MHNKRTTCVAFSIWGKSVDPNTLISSRQIECTCADPESFARGGPLLTTGEDPNKYHYKRATKRNSIVVDGPTMDAGMVAL